MTKKKSKPLNKQTLHYKKMLRMIVEWHDLTKVWEGEYDEWWKKYPDYSLGEVIDIARKKI